MHHEHTNIINKKNASLSIILLLFAFSAVAQTRISLNEAIQKSLANNREVTIADQKIQRASSLKRTAFTPNDLEIVFEAPTGEELRPGVLQGFQYFGVYTARAAALRGQVKAAQTEKIVVQKALTYDVMDLYNEMEYWQARTDLLKSQDSIFSDILRINQVRRRVGEISSLEQINSESRYREIEITASEAKAGLKSSQQRFAFLLGDYSGNMYLPDVSFGRFTRLTTPKSIDSSAVVANPLVQLQQNLLQVNQQNLKVEKRQRIPGLVLGFLNQGTKNTDFASRLRVGISLPIWFWANNGRIKAAEKELEISRNQTQLVATRLKSEYEAALAQYTSLNENLAYYETRGLSQAVEIIRTSRESYRLGSVTYYNYLQNLELAFQIRLRYLDTLRNYNRNLILMNYLLGQL